MFINFNIRTTTGFKEVTGYKKDKTYYYYKKDAKDWIITDAATGLMIVDKLAKSTDCLKWLKDRNNTDRIDELRKKDKYKEAVKLLQEYEKGSKKK